MAKTDFKSVVDYIAAQPVEAQATLQRVRSIIRKAMPAAEEVISYQIAAYKLNGRAVIYFAGWKEHYSLYPAGAQFLAAFGDELAPDNISKGTIRFPLSQPVPAKLIERIAKFRAKEAAERGQGTRATPSKSQNVQRAAKKRRTASARRHTRPTSR